MKASLPWTVGLFFLACWASAVVISIYGLILAFKASIILGIIALIVEPSPFIFGLVALFGTNVPEKIQAWLGLPV